MGIKIKPAFEESEGPAILPQATPATPSPEWLNDDFWAGVNSRMEVAAGNAVERAYSYADAMRRDSIAAIRTEADGVLKELRAYAKPSTQVMVVEIEGIRQKLSKPASKYLADMLHWHQLGKKNGRAINMWLWGPRGTGKTTAAEQLAEALGVRFAAMSLGADASSAMVFGTLLSDKDGRLYIPDTILIDFMKNGGVFLLDEAAGAGCNITNTLNTALEQRRFTNPRTGEVIDVHPDFVFLAADNTCGMGGDAVYTARERQDAAWLDRFEFLRFEYDRELEALLCPDEELRNQFYHAREVIERAGAKVELSSRRMQRAYLAKASGMCMSKVFASLTTGWPKGLVEQTGLTPSAHVTATAGAEF